MAICYKCGKYISFIQRKGKKPLVVNKYPTNFLLDSSGEQYFIHDGVLKRGTQVPDGLQGYTLHSCEVR